MNDNIKVSFLIGVFVHGHTLSTQHNGFPSTDNFSRRTGNLDASSIKMGDQYSRKSEKCLRERNGDVCQEVIPRTLERVVMAGFQDKYHIAGRHAGLNRFQLNTGARI